MKTLGAQGVPSQPAQLEKKLLHITHVYVTLVCSLQSAFFPQSAFYAQSAVCILH